MRKAVVIFKNEKCDFLHDEEVIFCHFIIIIYYYLHGAFNCSCYYLLMQGKDYLKLSKERLESAPWQTQKDTGKVHFVHQLPHHYRHQCHHDLSHCHRKLLV